MCNIIYGQFSAKATAKDIRYYKTNCEIEGSWRNPARWDVEPCICASVLPQATSQSHKPCSKSSTDPEPFSGFVCFSPGAGCKVSDLPKSPPKCWADEWPGTFAPSWCKSWFGATQQSVCSSFGVGNVEMPTPSSLSKVRFHYKWLANALRHPANVEGRQHERTWCPIGATSCVDLRAEDPTICKTVQTTPVILRQPNLAKWQCLWNFQDATSEVKRLITAILTTADLHERFQVAQRGLGYLAASWSCEKNAGVARGETQNWGYVVC